MTAELKRCLVDNCEKNIKINHKYCSMHAARLYRTGRLTLKTHKEKLLENVDIDLKTRCWNWTGYKTELGYGRLRLNNKKTLAHRASYEIFVGKIPDKKLVCHKCDNPSCLNPDHLFLGTNNDNVQDRVKKGRTSK